MLYANFYSAVCQLYHNKTEKSKNIKRAKVKKKRGINYAHNIKILLMQGNCYSKRIYRNTIKNNIRYQEKEQITCK